MDKEFINGIINNNSFTVEYYGENEMNIKDFEKFKIDKYQALYDFSFFDEMGNFNNVLKYLIKITKLMVKFIINHPLIEMSRENIVLSLSNDDVESYIHLMPFMLNENFITEEYIVNLFDKIVNIFKKEISVCNVSVFNYFKSKDDNLNVSSRIYFHIVENKDNDELPFAFLATYAKKDNNNVLHTPLEKALIEYKDDSDKLIYLLSAVNKVCDKSLLIKKLLDSGELFSPTYFTIEEAYQFFKEVSLYESFGIMCRIPKWQRNKKNSPIIKLNISKKNTINITSLLNLTPVIYIDDQEIDVNDLIEISKNDLLLVKYKNKWINTSSESLNKILVAIEKLNSNSCKNMSLFELMKLEFNPHGQLGIDNNVVIELNHSDWYNEFKNQLSNPKIISDVTLPKNLNANLRPYQQVGYNWLCKMLEFGLGACLADDMGLGKTLQVISVITKLYETDNLKTLLVVPSSLMFNWKKEFKKFSNIDLVIIHNSVGVKLKDFVLEDKVYITTYKMAKNLVDYKFDLLVIDEAQAIKNVGTAQTNSIKSIKASYKIALTGTPIENDLSDLYSLFDFLNKGLLGTKSEFVAKSNSLIEGDNYSELRKIVKPFILRRLKSDKSIINDLPEKIENTTYITLSKKQIELYQFEVDKIKDMLENEETFPKGLMLSIIMRFKQICNHPSQLLNDGIYSFEDSGKFDMLKVIAENVKENHERMLVFTQFKEMTQPLHDFLESIFGQSGLIIHGSTSVKKRDEMVTSFNGLDYVPFMVLSLKAGGTGLNLVSANNVVHFDRWWNPAVENQATDRAFRIGQTKNVNIFKFICVDTIEEKIDEILMQKQDLSDSILKSTNEAWIGKMSKKELLNLFKYGGKK